MRCEEWSERARLALGFFSRGSKGGSKGPRERERERSSATGIMFIQHLPLLSSKRIVLASASPRRSELLLDHWTQRKVTVDAEKSDGKKKSDGGRREK